MRNLPAIPPKRDDDGSIPVGVVVAVLVQRKGFRIDEKRGGTYFLSRPIRTVQGSKDPADGIESVAVSADHYSRSFSSAHGRFSNVATDYQDAWNLVRFQPQS